LTAAREIAAAKLNLALHVRGKRPDGRHEIETVFAFCIDGDRLRVEPADELSLAVSGPFATDLASGQGNLVLDAARALAACADIAAGAAIALDKRLPVAAGVGGGSADAAAALRLLTSMWSIDPKHAEQVAPKLGSDVPACLLSLPMRGDGAGDQLTPIDLSEISGAPVLLVNPRIALSTAEVFAGWDGVDRGPLEDWRLGRNELQPAAVRLVPKIETVLAWLSSQHGSAFVRNS
jgi:4-diphosphocytidyl-2-C-methyl-D-erythritol kinase